MLFEVNVRNTVVPGPDGVTFMDSADGFKSAWVSLPIPLPEARAISLATLCQQNQRPTGNSDGFEPVYTVYQPYRSPTSRGDFEIEVDFQLWSVSIEFQDDWTHCRSCAKFRGYNEHRLSLYRYGQSQGQPQYTGANIFVRIKLCCDVQACLQQQRVLHKRALLPLQKSLDDMDAQMKRLQQELVVKKKQDLQVQSTFDTLLAKSNRLHQWLIAAVVAFLVFSILSCLVESAVEGEICDVEV